MEMAPASRAPAFLNVKCGNAAEARTAFSKAGFELLEVEPEALVDEFRNAVARKDARIVVAGGDGTIAAAAAAAAGTATELAILPGGTLNHFAKDHGIPADLDEAAKVAAGVHVTSADLGYVEDRVFLNTSSIGVYVRFVRVRERLERTFGYRIASFLAFLRLLADFRTIAIELEVEGQKRIYRTPLVFIGVGERELQFPKLGSRINGGRRGLHVMVVRGRRPARVFALGLAALTRGTSHVSRTPEFDSFIVDSCTVDLRKPSAAVALDGEIHAMKTPLHFRIERDALRLVVSTPDNAE